MRERSSPPPSLVENGRFHFGVFDGPIANVNPLDAQPFSVGLPRAVLATRLKEWEAVQIVDDRFFAVVALFDAKSLALAQVKVFDRRTGVKHVFERKLPTWALKIGQGLLDSDSSYSGKDFTLRFLNRWKEGQLEVELDVPASGTFPGVRGKLSARAEGNDPLVVALPFGDNRGMYSHKGPLRVEGELQLGEETLTLGDATSVLLLDDHKGYYPVVMRWDWVAGAGRDAEGRRIAFNLTRNQSLDPDQFNENCLWIDGRAHLLPAVSFARTGCSVGDRWRITDEHGQVDVVFTVRAEGRVGVDALVIKSDYDGPFGSFDGTLRAEDGAEASVDASFGMGERFVLRC